MTTETTIALTLQSFVSKVMSLLFNTMIRGPHFFSKGAPNFHCFSISRLLCFLKVENPLHAASRAISPEDLPFTIPVAALAAPALGSWSELTFRSCRTPHTRESRSHVYSWEHIPLSIRLFVASGYPSGGQNCHWILPDL